MLDFLLQVASEATTADSFTSLITAIAILVGAIGGIAGTIATIISRRVEGTAKKTAMDVIDISNLSMEVAKQIVNNENKIKGIGNVIYALAPEDAKIYMDKANVPVKKLTQDVYDTTDQLNKLASYIPNPSIIDANHNGIPDELEIVETESENKEEESAQPKE